MQSNYFPLFAGLCNLPPVSRAASKSPLFGLRCNTPPALRVASVERERVAERVAGVPDSVARSRSRFNQLRNVKYTDV